MMEQEPTFDVKQQWFYTEELPGGKTQKKATHAMESTCYRRELSCPRETAGVRFLDNLGENFHKRVDALIDQGGHAARVATFVVVAAALKILQDEDRPQ